MEERVGNLKAGRSVSWRPSGRVVCAEPGLVGPPPSCTGTNSASNRDSHSESATTKEHRRFFVTSLKFTHGDDTWHLYTTVFFNGKTTNRLIQKKTRTKSFLQPLSHSKEMLQFSETIDPAGQHVKAKVMLQNVHKQTVLEPMTCLRPDTRMSLSKMFLDFRQ